MQEHRLVQKKENFVLQGDICYAPSPQQLVTLPQGYVVCQQGRSLGVYPQLPEAYQDWPLYDYRFS